MKIQIQMTSPSPLKIGPREKGREGRATQAIKNAFGHPVLYTKKSPTAVKDI